MILSVAPRPLLQACKSLLLCLPAISLVSSDEPSLFVSYLDVGLDCCDADQRWSEVLMRNEWNLAYVVS
jgi:hypothetical protein